MNALNQPRSALFHCLNITGLFLVACIWCQPASGQAGTSEARYRDGLALFEDARFNEALVVFESIAGDSTTSELLLSRTYKMLGVLYTIQRDHDSARDAIRQWIGSEPPRVEADPDIDMLEFVRLYYDVRKEINRERHCPPDFESPHPCEYALRPDPGIKTVAIVNFENNSVDDRERLQPLSSGFADIMIRELSSSSRLMVVDREMLDWIIEELKLGQSSVVDPAVAARVGHVLGAHAVLVGDFLHFDKDIAIGVRLVHVETTRVLLADSEQGRLDKFSDLTKKLSKKVAAKMDVELDESLIEGDASIARTLDALLATAEGNALYDQGDLLGARSKYEEALGFDNSYALAKQMLESIKLSLATAQTGPR